MSTLIPPNSFCHFTLPLLSSFIIKASKLPPPGGKPQDAASHLLSFAYTGQPVGEQLINLAVNTASGSLVLTGMRICYVLNDGNMVTKETFMPASLIDAAFY